jgi:hypothetical protein
LFENFRAEGGVVSSSQVPVIRIHVMNSAEFRHRMNAARCGSAPRQEVASTI